MTELTPEEKQRIYLEEKERLEAQNQAKLDLQKQALEEYKEKHPRRTIRNDRNCPECYGPSKRLNGLGCGWLLIILLTFPIGILLLIILMLRKAKFECYLCGYRFQT